MAKTIKFSHEGTDYTLEFTRNTIRTMESQGFTLSQVADKPISILPALFKGAFLAHHKFVKAEVIDKIFAKMTNREKLFELLAEMYNEPIVALMDEPAADEGNISWTTD